ncbi:hypothetical protein VZ236_01360 [Metamycoplasma hominis]|uniref:hypothetical protein n=1 Tax=Metamycoplasma hominis TaxID=2098 RepID=UPI0034AB05F7
MLFLVCSNSANLFSLSLLNCCSCLSIWLTFASNDSLADYIEAVLFDATACFAFLISASNAAFEDWICWSESVYS